MGNDAIKEQMIDEISEYEPVVFVQALKQQLGIRISQAEIEYVELIQKEKLIPNSVLNAVVIYILMIKKQKVLNLKYMRTIANDWSEKGIVTPKKAVDQVFKLKEPRNKGQAKTRTTVIKKPIIREVPDYILHPRTEVEMSPEREEKLQRKIDEYLKKSEENEKKALSPRKAVSGKKPIIREVPDYFSNPPEPKKVSAEEEARVKKEMSEFGKKFENER